MFEFLVGLLPGLLAGMGLRACCDGEEYKAVPVEDCEVPEPGSTERAVAMVAVHRRNRDVAKLVGELKKDVLEAVHAGKYDHVSIEGRGAVTIRKHLPSTLKVEYEAAVNTLMSEELDCLARVGQVDFLRVTASSVWFGFGLFNDWGVVVRIRLNDC